ncbi:MAG: hypothetical protein K0S80_1478 [Neobacillus sp.]|nr:hypothetical protein [Neobacillus sp.]
MNTIKIDRNCSGCQLCYQACFMDVLRWDEKAKRPIAAYQEDCVDCLYCETVCAKNAIHVIIDFKKTMANAY